MEVDPRHFWKLVTIARQRRREQRSGQEKVETNLHPFKDMWVDLKAIRHNHRRIVTYIIIVELAIHLTAINHFGHVFATLHKMIDLLKLIPFADEFIK